MATRTFLIDTDTASDDAVALIMALQHLDVRVAAVTVVAGNVELPKALRNALYTVELCGRGGDVPVYAGAEQPLTRELSHAEWFHGRDGLGDQNYPAPTVQAREGHAVDAILATVDRETRETRTARPGSGAGGRRGGITLVTLGPLTNIALALKRDPTLARKISRCVIMGGNPCCEGNVTPAAEYNIWVDPEAARIVLLSGMPIELVGWQLCRGEANLKLGDIQRVRDLNTPLAHFAIDSNRSAMEANRVQSGEIGIALPDPVAMAVALDPSIATSATHHHVEVETQSELTRGMTVVDRLDVAGDARNRGGAWKDLAGKGRNVSVVWSIDIARWKALLLNSLSPVRGGMAPPSM